jgi:hypothetical protein
MSSFNKPMWLNGVLWEVEIDFTFFGAEPDTGMSENVELNRVWLLGHYPEQNPSKRDYVPTNIRIDLQECKPDELKHFEDEIYEYLEQVARDDFDYAHSYED